MQLNKPAEAEAELEKYKVTLPDNPNALLLLARAQKAQGKIEAANTYSRWLSQKQDNEVLYEYAQVLEMGKFYARAIETYQKVLAALPKDKTASASASGGAANAKTSSGPDRGEVHFSLARLMLIADPTTRDGFKELKSAVEDDGFLNVDKLKSLMTEKAITKANKDSIDKLIDEAKDIIAKKEADKEAAKEKAKKEAEKKAEEKKAAETNAASANSTGTNGTAANGTAGTGTTTGAGTGTTTGTSTTNSGAAAGTK
jgi:tetratricopeptide (TPR) repeat protein